ncbi:hypothetical protein BO99DRAFT_210307 [Aspergillus violaceofuscus CBS 115571]|uniref:RING-type domain-containing protein n=1 Tax=Aspergillus violaceofuscus (strain CBS 115571) TaxID=1450538 RepID=A0A2V5H061_ASPV1|nr:hypothetical protein BO99DRAFT_210307 [Aspergillus violaceofuscus CBS 115571]
MAERRILPGPEQNLPVHHPDALDYQALSLILGEALNRIGHWYVHLIFTYDYEVNILRTDWSNPGLRHTILDLLRRTQISDLAALHKNNEDWPAVLYRMERSLAGILTELLLTHVTTEEREDPLMCEFRELFPTGNITVGTSFATYHTPSTSASASDVSMEVLRGLQRLGDQERARNRRGRRARPSNLMLCITIAENMQILRMLIPHPGKTMLKLWADPFEYPAWQDHWPWGGENRIPSQVRLPRPTPADAAPVASQRAIGPDDKCPICYGQFHSDDPEEANMPVVWCARCGQNFHGGCLSTWLGRAGTCPLCSRLWRTGRTG